MQQGDIVPDFTATDQEGRSVSLSGLLENGPMVLFFYPKAFTPGCTKETCHFRDLAGEFAAIGAQRVGVSADKVEKQAAFDQEHAVGFPLLSDANKSIAAIFGVKRPLGLFNKRTTFVIDTDRRILEVISSEMNMELHADRALEVLRSRQPS